MRKTLHMLPRELAIVAHRATLHYRVRDARRAVVRSGVTDAQLAQCSEWVRGELTPEWMAGRDLVARGVTAGFVPGAVRVVLKLLWERGEVVYRNTATSWHRMERAFAIAPEAFVVGASDLDVDEAKALLIGEYYRRYGPATVRDARWWSGLSGTDVRAALRRLDTTTVALPWCEAPGYMLTEDHERAMDSLRAYDTPAHHVNFLAHEDVALKAYFESRARYLDAVPVEHAFNQIGEVHPLIMYDGRVIGRWVWNHDTRRVTTRLFRRVTVSSATRTQVRQGAQQLERGLRSGYHP